MNKKWRGKALRLEPLPLPQQHIRLLIRGIKVISLLSIYNLTHLTGNYCQPGLTSNRLLQSDMLLWCSKNSSSALLCGIAANKVVMDNLEGKGMINIGACLTPILESESECGLASAKLS